MAKVHTAHDEAGFVDVPFAIPSEIEECAGYERTEDVKHWCHGSVPLGVDTLKFLGDGIEYHVKRSSDSGRVVGCLGNVVCVGDGFLDGFLGCKQWAV